MNFEKLNSDRVGVLKKLFAFNLALLLYFFASNYWVKFIKSSVLEYSNITSDPFDWTVSPITFVPNWMKSKNTNKSMDFSDDRLSIDEFVELPKYDTTILSDASWKNTDSILARYTYPVVYMWNYKLDYEEYAWSHPWVDIRAPIWTPVLSIANWVVVKVKNTETWDWKYVIIRHDNVPVWNSTETLYSAYEHLSDIFAQEWTKITKWDVLWKVWMTWITTTPHLHFQIDKKVAPFHAYWPFTFSEANAVWLDFFSAIDTGLGKEKSMEYTINCMEFVQDNLKKLVFDSAPIIEQASASNSPEAWTWSESASMSLWSSPATEDNSFNVESGSEMNSVQDVLPIQTIIQEEQTGSVSEPEIKEEQPIGKQEETVNTTVIENQSSDILDEQVFSDIPVSSKYYDSTKFLYEKWVAKWYRDWSFWISWSLTRWEALILIFKLFPLLNQDDSAILPFSDVNESDFLAPFLKRALNIWLISPNWSFRPDDTISRAEFATILVKASWNTIIKPKTKIFSDVSPDSWYAPYVATLDKNFPLNKKAKFEPNWVFSRWQIALILYSFAK